MEAKLAAPVTRDAPTKRRRRSGFASSPRYSALNDRMATALSLLVLIIAVPMASNRPIWWLVWGIVIGGLACVYLWRSRRIDRARRLQIHSYRLLFGVALLVPLFGLAQALPYAQFLPAGLTALPAALQGIKPPAISVLPDATVLGALRARGLKLGVVTNDAEAPAHAHLAAAGITDLFDFVAGFDSGHGAKPAPGPLLAFCRATGLTPARVAMVGDSRHDLEAGRAAGMHRIAVLTGIATAADLAPHADAVLPDIGGLAAWIDALTPA